MKQSCIPPLRILFLHFGQLRLAVSIQRDMPTKDFDIINNVIQRKRIEQTYSDVLVINKVSKCRNGVPSRVTGRILIPINLSEKHLPRDQVDWNGNIRMLSVEFHSPSWFNSLIDNFFCGPRLDHSSSLEDVRRKWEVFCEECRPALIPNLSRLWFRTCPTTWFSYGLYVLDIEQYNLLRTILLDESLLGSDRVHYQLVTKDQFSQFPRSKQTMY